ncbi:MAG: hypothetical protein IPM54_32960 [Polyangiaceae bacterium]|nr:hypothetical protein [Polyangiaceae bacterium]
MSFLRTCLVTLALASASLFGCKSTDSFETGNSVDVDDAPDGLLQGTRLSTNSTYYIARHDTRRCAAPMCGGIFVSAVNQTTTRCPGGTWEEECYISSIDFSSFAGSTKVVPTVRDAIGYDSSTTRVVLLGTLHPTLLGFGTMRVQMAWVALDQKPITGSFFKARENGIVCVAAPCPSYDEELLNRGTITMFHGIDFRDVEPHADDSTFTGPALRSNYGLIVSGENYQVEDAGPAGDATYLLPSQVFLPMDAPGRLVLGRIDNAVGVLPLAQ